MIIGFTFLQQCSDPKMLKRFNSDLEKLTKKIVLVGKIKFRAGKENH